MKNCDIFVFAQCIDFGYRFEPPLNEAVSNKYQQSMFKANMYTLEHLGGSNAYHQSML